MTIDLEAARAERMRLLRRVAELELALEAHEPNHPALSQIGDEPQEAEWVRVLGQEARGLVARYRTALEFYAACKWGWDGDDRPVIHETPVDEPAAWHFKDGGALARKALDGGDE